MKTEKCDTEINRKRGKRLKECIEYKNITQDELATKIPCSANYLSMLVNGKRLVDWDKACRISNILGVNPAYIMLESDNMVKEQYSVGYEEHGNTDLAFIHFLLFLGHEITFRVVLLYDGKQPTKIERNGKLLEDWDSLRIDVSINALKEFSFSDSHCMLETDDGLSECVITEVSLDGYKMKYGHFVYFMFRMYDYINFTCESLRGFEDDRDYSFISDELDQKEIEASRHLTHGASPLRTKEDIIKHLEKQFGKGNVRFVTPQEIEAQLKANEKDNENDSSAAVSDKPYSEQ